MQCDQRRGASETGTVPMARVHHKEPICRQRAGQIEGLRWRIRDRIRKDRLRRRCNSHGHHRGMSYSQANDSVCQYSRGRDGLLLVTLYSMYQKRNFMW